MAAFKCPFVFQYRYGNKWATYSTYELDILNEALRNNQKTVTLPGEDPKKSVVINFEDMTHRNKVSRMERRVRCLLFSTKFYTWMWEDEDDQFSSFTPFQVYYLESASGLGFKEVKFFNYGDYTVNLTSLELLEEETLITTPVIHKAVNLGSSELIPPMYLLFHRYQNEELTNLKSALQKRIFNPALVTQATPSTSSGLDLSASILNEEDAETSHFVNKYVDLECPDANRYRVYSVGEVYYGVSLTYTNLENNINKYLIMQILVRKGKYYLWQRWSRIGYRAQHDLSEFDSRRQEVITKFEDKFFKKTKNKWQNVSNFKKFHGFYDLLQVDFTPEKKEDLKTKLPASVQGILSLITSRKMMNKIMNDMNYNSEKIPLGKLTVSQIKEGYSALTKIERLIYENGKGKDLVNACDEFYTKIPHNFGQKNPQVISTLGDVEKKLEMLEALLNIHTAVNILNDTSNITQHPLDRYYTSLQCELKHLKKNNKDFLAIKKNIHEIHGPTHSEYNLELLEVFSCNKTTQSFIDRGNKLLLWHGSRMANWIGILKEGLRIAPPEAPSTGRMFGTGLYFADVCSKSANYCSPDKKNVGLLLLCEVSLGKTMNCYKELHRDFEVPAGYDSVVGKGQWVPTDFQPLISSCDARLPIGPIVSASENGDTLKYNEYVIYNTKQVRMKYLCKVQFNYK